MDRAPASLDAGARDTRTDLASLADRLRAFCVGQDDIVAAYLFGSTVAGTAGTLSDVDVALLLDVPEEPSPEAATGARRADLAARLPSALGSRTVDVDDPQLGPGRLGVPRAE